MNNNTEISVVIPVYNEEGNLPELYKFLKEVFEDKLKTIYKLIFVDDRSKDKLWQITKNLHKKDNCDKGIKFYILCYSKSNK